MNRLFRVGMGMTLCSSFVMLLSLAGCEGCNRALRSGPAKVVPGRDYLLTIVHARIPSAMPDGQPWDSLNGSGPDPYFEIWWKGNRVYQSSPELDTLIPRFRQKELNWVRILRSEVIEATRSGAVVTIEAGESIGVALYDDDPIDDDLIVKERVPMTSLVVGQNEVRFGTGGGNFKLVVVPIEDDGPRR